MKLLAIILSLLCVSATLRDASADTLLFEGGKITRYYQSGSYSTSGQVNLTATPYSNVPTALLGFVAAQINSGETLGQVLISANGQTPATYTNEVSTNSDGQSVTNAVPASYRPVLSASCTVIAPPPATGQRQLTITSEQLPSDPAMPPGNLRDGLLAAWAYVTSLP